MPQGSLSANIALETIAGVRTRAPLNLDASGNLLVNVNAGGAGGTTTVLGLSAPAVIKATAGKLEVVMPVSASSSTGLLTFNDATSVANASASNIIFSIAASALVAYTALTIDWPCVNGIVCSSAGGSTNPIKFNAAFE